MVVVVVVVVIRSMAKEIVRDLLSIFLLLSLIEVFSASVSSTGLPFPANEEPTFSHIFKGDTTISQSWDNFPEKNPKYRQML